MQNKKYSLSEYDAYGFVDDIYEDFSLRLNLRKLSLIDEEGILNLVSELERLVNVYTYDNDSLRSFSRWLLVATKHYQSKIDSYDDTATKLIVGEGM